MVSVYDTNDNLTDEAEELLILLNSLEPASLEEIVSLYEPDNPFEDEAVKQAAHLLSDQGVIESVDTIRESYFRQTRTSELLTECQREGMVVETTDGYQLDQNLRTLRFRQQSLESFASS